MGCQKSKTRSKEVMAKYEHYEIHCREQLLGSGEKPNARVWQCSLKDSEGNPWNEPIKFPARIKFLLYQHPDPDIWDPLQSAVKIKSADIDNINGKYLDYLRGEFTQGKPESSKFVYQYFGDFEDGATTVEILSHLSCCWTKVSSFDLTKIHLGETNTNGEWGRIGNQICVYSKERYHQRWFVGEITKVVPKIDTIEATVHFQWYERKKKRKCAYPSNRRYFLKNYLSTAQIEKELGLTLDKSTEGTILSKFGKETTIVIVHIPYGHFQTTPTEI